MDAMGFYSKTNIDLEDIQTCAQRAGYKTNLRPDLYGDVNELVIVFQSKTRAGVSHYWTWWKYEKILSRWDIEEQTILKLIWEEVQSEFSISYAMGYIEELIEFMQEILVCYDGYISFEGAIFDKSNLETMRDYVPQPPDDNSPDQ